jgi:hypothetical protein
MGTVRLWNHHLGSRNRTALYALVHPGIPEKPVDPRFYAADGMKNAEGDSGMLRAVRTRL